MWPSSGRTFGSPAFLNIVFISILWQYRHPHIFEGNKMEPLCFKDSEEEEEKEKVKIFSELLHSTPVGHLFCFGECWYRVDLDDSHRRYAVPCAAHLPIAA